MEHNCPFCQSPMALVKPEVALRALGIDTESTLGSMVTKALNNPKGNVYQCSNPACKFIGIFGT